MSSRCQTGCQMAAHHWVFKKVDHSKASEAAVPSEMTFHSPPLDFCCLLYLSVLSYLCNPLVLGWRSSSPTFNKPLWTLFYRISSPRAPMVSRGCWWAKGGMGWITLHGIICDSSMGFPCFSHLVSPKSSLNLAELEQYTNLKIVVWLVVDLPLRKIWVRQLGWWHSQDMESHKIPWFQTTNHINTLWLFNIAMV